MATLFAICNNPDCKAIFPVPNIIGGNAPVNIQMVGTTYGPCPICGSQGHIPDGIYEMRNDIIQDVISFPQSVEELEGLRSFFRSRLITGISKEELIDEVSKITKGESLVRKIVNSPMSITDIIQCLCTILTLAILLQTTYFKREDVNDEAFRKYLIEENRWYRENTHKQVSSYPKYIPSTVIPKLKKSKSLQYNRPSLNGPCPCGSGKQYKRCHGRS